MNLQNSQVIQMKWNKNFRRDDILKKAELLAPAGNMEKFKMALHYGADAVFMGGKMFNLRAVSNNFSY